MDGIVSAERLEEIKNRSKRCVCKYCGGRLRVRMLDFGQIETANLEIFCENCDKIEYGVEPEIYHSAQYAVDILGFNAYQDRADNEQRRRLNIAKVCELLFWHDRELGILDQYGYKVPVADPGENMLDNDGSIIIDGEKIL
ncbi:MAG: hypothetical protein DBX41_06750 [Clostridiales bacterium]|nr:MAG: hypothetical protein DBX41_06750 [Clostridiales bacterium]